MNIKYKYLLVSFLLFVNLYGQTNGKKIISKNKYNTNKTDVHELLKQTTNLYYSDPDSAKIIALKVLQIGDSNNDFLTISKTYNSLGIISDVKGNWKEAISNYNKAILNARKVNDINIEASALNNIGIIHAKYGNYKEALEHYQKALKLFEEFHSVKNISNSYNNIGTILYKQDRLEEALIYFRKAGRKRKAGKTITGTAYSNIAQIYQDLNKIDSSFHYINLAIPIKEKRNDIYGLIPLYNNLGLLYEKTGKYKHAINSYLKSLKLTEKVNSENNAIIPLMNLGTIYNEHFKDTLNAEKYYLKAEAIAEKYNTTDELIELYFTLGKLYNDKKKYDLSSEYLLKRVKLNDSLQIIKRDKIIAQLQAKFELKENQKEIKNLNQENKIKQQKLIIKNYLLSSLFLVMVIIIVFVFFFKQKANQKIQNMENELQKYILKIENINHSSKDTSEILSKEFIDEYKLTERESEILLFLSKGLSYSAIGKYIHISENTVKYHISNLYFKLDVKKKSEALNKFYKNKIRK